MNRVCNANKFEAVIGIAINENILSKASTSICFNVNQMPSLLKHLVVFNFLSEGFNLNVFGTLRLEHWIIDWVKKNKCTESLSIVQSSKLIEIYYCRSFIADIFQLEFPTVETIQRYSCSEYIQPIC